MFVDPWCNYHRDHHADDSRVPQLAMPCYSANGKTINAWKTPFQYHCTCTKTKNQRMKISEKFLLRLQTKTKDCARYTERYELKERFNVSFHHHDTQKYHNASENANTSRENKTVAEKRFGLAICQTENRRPRHQHNNFFSRSHSTHSTGMVIILQIDMYICMNMSVWGERALQRRSFESRSYGRFEERQRRQRKMYAFAWWQAKWMTFS